MYLLKILIFFKGCVWSVKQLHDWGVIDCIFLLFQDKATSGKQGLGIKDRPKKIAGVRFQGKKTTFDNSEDEDSADYDEDSDADDDVSADFPSAKQNCDILEMENVEVKIVDKDSVDFCISGKRKREDTPKMQEINEQKVKLKSLCKRLLHQVPPLTLLAI